jgi:hypothetical protein
LKLNKYIKTIKTVLWRNEGLECVNRRIGVEKEV